jgi:hypothetical protein
MFKSGYVITRSGIISSAYELSISDIVPDQESAKLVFEKKNTRSNMRRNRRILEIIFIGNNSYENTSRFFYVK